MVCLCEMQLQIWREVLAGLWAYLWMFIMFQPISVSVLFLVTAKSRAVINIAAAPVAKATA